MALRVGLALGLLAYVLITNREQIAGVLARRPDLRLFGLAFGLYFGGVLLAFLRWFLLVRSLDLPFRLRDAYRLGLIGALFNFVIPGAVGGDFVKAAYLCRMQGKRTGPIASVVVDRIVGLLGLFLLACAAGTLGWSSLDGPVRRLVALAWICAGGTALVLVLGFLPIRLLPRGSKLGAELGAVGAAYRNRFGVVVLGTGMACVTHTLNVLAFAVLGRALFPTVASLTEQFLIVPLVLFSTGVPLPFGALGVSEQVSARLFLLAENTGGAVTMLSFRLLQLGAAILGALVYLANQAQVRELTEAAEHLDEELSEPAPDQDGAIVPVGGEL